MHEFQLQLKSLKKQYASMNGLFSGKKREELAEKIENLQNEITLYKENRKYALLAREEMDGLKVTSEKVGNQIEELKIVHDSKVEEYRGLEATVSEEDSLRVRQERLSVRPDIESKLETDKKFHIEAEKVDRTLGCTISDLSGDNDLGFRLKMKG